MKEKTYKNITDFIQDLGFVGDEENYRLERLGDGLLFFSEEIAWIEWEDESFKSFTDTPELGKSLILGPLNVYFTWMTTPITKIIENNEEQIHFKTKNSEYKLTWKKITNE